VTDHLTGIHHVIAIGGNPQRTVDFYPRTLALRLAKLTVNRNCPGAYRLCVGEEQGRPGTVLKFFSSPGALRGRVAIGSLRHGAWRVRTDEVQAARAWLAPGPA
jgi:glyoxalase family protein